MAIYHVGIDGGEVVPLLELTGADVFPTSSGIVVQPYKTETVTPTKNTQTVRVDPDVGYDAIGYGITVVDPIPEQYIVPTGTKYITDNGTYDVIQYAAAKVLVSGGGSLQTKSVSYTPSETAISDSVTPDPGYDGMDQVNVSVGAISSTYVGSGIARNDSTDLTASGATVTAPAGYYPEGASKTIPNASTPYGGIDNIDSSGNVDISIEIDNGGYIGDGTYSITDAVPVQAAQTITPGTTNQTITRGKWLGGDQTILGDADLVAENIKKDVTIFGVTGTYEGSGGGGQKVLINESVITQNTASVVVDNITYDNLYITTTGLKTAKTSSMGMFLKVTGSICGNKTCTMYSGNVFASIGNHSGWCKIEDLGNGYKQAIRTDAPALPENTMAIRFLGVGNNSTPSPYQFGDITKIEIVPSESAYPFTAGTIRVYGW